MFRTVFLLLSGNAFSSLMLLLRNLLVARLVSVEDYGVAATFAISMAVVEMASGLGLQQMIVQDRAGNDPKLQAGLQAFHLVRSLLGGLALFLLASPIAHFLGIPEITWAYQLLAAVPVVRGFEHFDIHRLNRRFSYGPLILSKAIPAFVSLLAVWPLFWMYGDYRIMLFAILIQWPLVVLVTHLLSERPYRLSFDRSVTAHALRFGLPLLGNNILLFVIFQGDKLIVGRELGMEALAIFAMGTTLTLTPTLVLSASMQQFFLPRLSAARENTRFTHLALAAMQCSLVAGLTLVVAVILIGRPMVEIILGAKYASLLSLLTWMGIQQALRIFKAGSTDVALSRAQTSNPLIANSFRILTLPIVWYVTVNGGSLVEIVWIAAAGEIASYAVSIGLVSLRLKLRLSRLIVPQLATISVLALAAVDTTTMPSGVGLTTLAVVVMYLISLLGMTELRQYFMFLLGGNSASRPPNS